MTNPCSNDLRMRVVVLALASLLTNAQASANHPGHDLDSEMGGTVRLSQFADKIGVLHFICAGCPNARLLYAHKLAQVQSMVNALPSGIWGRGCWNESSHFPENSKPMSTP